MIQLTISGNCGRDATAKTLENGKTVVSFSVGVQTGYGDKKNTVWVDCSYWVTKTGITEYLKKGTKVLCVGEGGVRTYAKQDGTAGVSMTLNIREIELLGGKQDQTHAEPVTSTTSAKSTEAAKPTEQFNANNITEEFSDLPF